mmetsp:Transcript_36903/g.76740  ORF Transcript_36903/g.76740 Transcript_36903/m.76740 type:complete len:283 (+) Transcript_36903:644-1492(+)
MDLRLVALNSRGKEIYTIKTTIVWSKQFKRVKIFQTTPSTCMRLAVICSVFTPQSRLKRNMKIRVQSSWPLLSCSSSFLLHSSSRFMTGPLCDAKSESRWLQRRLKRSCPTCFRRMFKLDFWTNSKMTSMQKRRNTFGRRITSRGSSKMGAAWERKEREWRTFQYQLQIYSPKRRFCLLTLLVSRHGLRQENRHKSLSFSNLYTLSSIELPSAARSLRWKPLGTAMWRWPAYQNLDLTTQLQWLVFHASVYLRLSMSARNWSSSLVLKQKSSVSVWDFTADL